MHCVLLYFVEVAEVMRRVLLCMLEAVEGRLCSPEAFVVSGMRRRASHPQAITTPAIRIAG